MGGGDFGKLAWEVAARVVASKKNKAASIIFFFGCYYLLEEVVDRLGAFGFFK